MVHKVERQLIDVDMGLVDCTVEELVLKYLETKQLLTIWVINTGFNLHLSLIFC